MIGSFAFAVTAGLLPQGLLLGVALVCVMLAAIRPSTPISLYRWLSCLALVGAISAALINLYGLRQARLGVGLVAYGGSLIVDRFSVFGTVLIAVLALMIVGGATQGRRIVPNRAGARHALILVATAAAALLTAEREMIALFATLQVFLLSVSLLAALDKTSARSTEAAVKYLILGAVGSVVLLYGLTILYGVTGSTDLAAVPAAYAAAPTLTLTGVALTLLGLCVAVGALPFHQATVQLAAGGPAVASGFGIVIGAVAGVAVYLRVVVGGFGPTVHAGLELTAVIAALTMLYPALMLLRDGSLRRAAGHLMVAQIGFALVGVLSISQGSDHRAGIVALLIYAIGAGVTGIALFGLINILEAAGFNDAPLALRGLGHRTGTTAFGLAIVLASLGGLPPTAIFVARMLTLESAVVAGYAWVAIVALVSTVLLVVACVRMIALMYEESGAERLPTASAPLRARVVVAGCASAAVIFTAVIQPLLAVSSGAAGTLPLR